MADRKDQPAALRLADVVERYNRGVCSQAIAEDYLAVARELRRQHARIAELEEQMAAIGAGGVGPLMGKESSDAR